MPAASLDGKALAAELTASLKKRVASAGIKPVLGTLLVGDDPASKLYVSLKKKACEAVGGEFRLTELPASASTKAVVAEIRRMAKDDSIDGILVQLPFPDGIDSAACLSEIPLAKDVDGLNPLSLATLFERQSTRTGFMPATTRGIVALLDSAKVDIKGKRAVVIGRSVSVGIPTAAVLLMRDATVTMAHSKTQDLAGECRGADIVVSAAGKAGLVTGAMLKPGAVVIDVGTNFINSKDGRRRVVGDVAKDAWNVAGRISPVPGGSGPMTIACLVENLVDSALARAKARPAAVKR